MMLKYSDNGELEVQPFQKHWHLFIRKKLQSVNCVTTYQYNPANSSCDSFITAGLANAWKMYTDNM